MAIAPGFFAGAGSAMEAGNQGFEIIDEQRKTLWLGPEREQLLFEIQIERQRAGKIKREHRRVGSGEILGGAGDGQQLGVQLHRTRGFFLTGRGAGFVIDHQNFRPKKRALLVHAQDFETLASLGNDVELTVRIFFDNADDFGGAPYFGEILFHGPHHSEAALLGEAFADHFFVTWFEDVQGQRNAGKQDDVEGKEWQEGVQSVSRAGAAIRAKPALRP